MYGLAGPVIDIETDTESIEAIAHLRVIFVDDRFRGRIFFQCLVGDSRSMLIASADEHHVFADSTEVSNVNVGGNIGPGQMPDVFGTVGVGKSRGNGMSFILSHVAKINVLI